MECIISIELGTNAVRVYAFDLTGSTIGFAKGSYPTFIPILIIVNKILSRFSSPCCMF
jgi:sugar (pentulose or hexulose) kinase